MHLVVLTFFALGASAEDPPPARAQPSAPTGPLVYRCDSMRVKSKPNRIECTGNIVARRDTLMVCCERFEGAADDKWQWLSFQCKDNVRAVRGSELMWSDSANFNLENGELVLVGNPRLRRGPNLLDGTSIVIDTNTDRAQVVKPKGRLDPDANEVPDAVEIPKGDLPPRCPLPERVGP